MSTRDPGFNRALEIAGQNILDAFFKKASLDFQKRVHEDQLSLARDEFDEKKRAESIDRILKVAPFIKPGTLLAENDVLHDDFRRAFPGSDPTNVEGEGGIVWNPETFENTIMPELIGQFRGLSPEARAEVSERGLNKLLIGEGLSGKELSLRNTITDIQATALDAEAILRDPKLMRNIALKALGQEPLVRIMLDGKEEIFDSTTAANLTVEIWKHRRLLDYYRSRDSIEGKNMRLEMAKITMDQVSTASGGKIQLSLPNALRLIDTTMQPVDTNDQQAMAQYQQDIDNLKKMSPEMSAVTDLFMFSKKLEEETINFFGEANQGLGNYAGMIRTLTESGLPKEVAAEIAPGMARQLQDHGFPIAAPRKFRWFGLATPFTNLEGRSSVGESAPAGVGGPNTGGRSVGPTVDQQIQMANQAAADFVDGKVTMAQLKRQWGDDAARAIIQKSQILRSQRR